MIDYGGSFTDVVDSINDVSGSWYDPVIEMAGDFVDWMEANPTAAKMIGGAATGALSYYNQKDQQKYDEKMYNRRKSDALENSRASSGDGGYSDYATKLTGGTGLLTNGKLVQR